MKLQQHGQQVSTINGNIAVRESFESIMELL